MISWLAGFFMNPALALGAAGVASPILIHLLARRRFRKIRWAAMEFLMEALRRNRRRIRLEQFILLALRCLAILLLAMMVARPFIRHGTVGSMLGLGARTERIILLDDSYSMDCRVGPAETRWTRAKGAAVKIAELVAAEAPGDPISIITSSRAAQPLFSLASLSPDTAHAVKAALDSTFVTERTARFDSVVDSLVQMLGGTPISPNTTLYLISDFQRPDWAHFGQQNPSPFGCLKELKNSGRRIQLVCVDVSNSTPRNLAILGLRPLQPQTIAGIPARFEVIAQNFGEQAISDAEVMLSIAGQVLPPVALPALAPGQRLTEQLEVSFPVEGSNFLKVELGGAAANEDPLKLDNVRWAAVDVLPAIQVLLVNGEPSADSYRDEVYLLKTALRPAGRAASGNEVTVVEEQELDTAELQPYHVVVLANASRLSIAAQKNIESYVENGGGLVIFGGDQVDISWHNEQLFRAGGGVLPARLIEVVETPGNVEPPGFAQWDEAHPVFRAFRDSLAKLLRQVKVHAFVKVDESSAPGPTTTSAPTEGAVRIVARWDDAEKSPAMIQKPYGRGRCTLITTSADQEWNDWAASFSYVPFMLELMQHCSRPPDVLEQSIVGQPLTYSADPRRYSAMAIVRPPGYPAEPELTINSTGKGGTQAEYVIENTAKSGPYQLRLNMIGGRQTTRIAVVNPESSESDIAPVTPAQLTLAMGDMAFEHVRELDDLLDDVAHARTELWWPLLLLAVAALMSEQALAWYFGTRG